MTESNDVVRTLLANFPIAELGSEEQRQIFDRLRARIGQAPDAAAELKNLYKVKGLSDFASVIMWILERTQKHPQMAVSSPDDERLLLSAFRRAMGDQTLAPASSGGEPMSDERSFASKLDRFSEAVQNGTEGRGAQLESLFSDCEGISSRTTDVDFKEFGALMADFLKYIAESELLDDVRVINIVSNISSTISQWAVSPPDARHGLLEEVLGMLKDFRTHFE